MPSRRLRGADLPTAGGTGPGGLVRGRAPRPRARGVDSGGLSARERPSLLGGREGDEGQAGRTEEGSKGRFYTAQELKARILISEVLRGYGARTGFTAQWTSTLCPFHEDRHASASYNDAIGQFYCHGCEVHGDIFDIVQHAEGVEFPGAVEIIAKEFG